MIAATVSRPGRCWVERAGQATDVHYGPSAVIGTTVTPSGLRHAVWPAVGEPATSDRDERDGFAVSLGVNRARQVQQGLSRRIRLSLPQLDLDARPTAVREFEDGVDLLVLPGVTPRRECCSERLAVHAEVPHRQRLEVESGRVQVREEVCAAYSEGRCSEGGIDEVANRARSQPGARAKVWLPGRERLDEHGPIKGIEIVDDRLVVDRPVLPSDVNSDLSPVEHGSGCASERREQSCDVPQVPSYIRTE